MSATLNGRQCATVRPVAGAYAIRADVDNGLIFTNAGTVGTFFDLPPATVGQRYAFAVSIADTLLLSPHGSDAIALPATGAYLSPGASLVSSTVGSYVAYVCVTPGFWNVTHAVGTWEEPGS